MADYGKLGVGLLGVAFIPAFIGIDVFAPPLVNDGSLLLAAVLCGALFLDYAWLSRLGARTPVRSVLRESAPIPWGGG